MAIFNSYVNLPEGTYEIQAYDLAYDSCERELKCGLKAKHLRGETKSGKLRLQGENKFANGTRYSNLFSQNLKY
jgi:hypothetical protein